MLVAAVAVLIALRPSHSDNEAAGGAVASSDAPDPADASAAPVASSIRAGPLGPIPIGEPGRQIARTPSAPDRLTITSIGVRASLQRIGLNRDGTLQAPSRWGEAGWFAGGIVPGQVGPAVIVGHIDSTSGPAVFYRLSQLRPGARVTITTRNHSELTFVVDRLQRFTKAHFPASSVYAATPDPELRLVTCTGAFDASTGQYLDNLVVSAHLV
jgi:hypothetical protein